MDELISKKYAKALIDNKEIKLIYSQLKTISTAYNSQKFMSIISSLNIDSHNKTNLILSFIDDACKSLTNLIKLLAKNDRLHLIPSLVYELKKELSSISNMYEGVIYTNEKLLKKDVLELEKQFSKKFNISLKLIQNVCSFDGLKIIIGDLDIEIGFSKERFKSQIANHIAKAF